MQLLSYIPEFYEELYKKTQEDKFIKIYNFFKALYESDTSAIIKNIDDIHFSQSISMFHDINELFILFHQLICIPCNKQNTFKKENGTKKIYINLNTNKKTKRKLYKESTL